MDPIDAIVVSMLGGSILQAIVNRSLQHLKVRSTHLNEFTTSSKLSRMWMRRTRTIASSIEARSSEAAMR
jgi:hypothetical protein